MLLQIEPREVGGGVTALRMNGRICMGRDCQQVEWQVADLIKADKKKVVFDMGGITLIDSTGVGIVATCFGRLKRAGGELRIAGVQGNVKDILSMTHLDKVIPIYPSADAAAENF